VVARLLLLVQTAILRIIIINPEVEEIDRVAVVGTGVVYQAEINPYLPAGITVHGVETEGSLFIVVIIVVVLVVEVIAGDLVGVVEVEIDIVVDHSGEVIVDPEVMRETEGGVKVGVEVGVGVEEAGVEVGVEVGAGVEEEKLIPEVIVIVVVGVPIVVNGKDRYLRMIREIQRSPNHHLFLLNNLN